MRRLLFIVGLVTFSLGAPCAFGQVKQFERFELFGGYSPSRNFGDGNKLFGTVNATMHGWNGPPFSRM